MCTHLHMNADGEIKREIGGNRRSNAEHLGNKKKKANPKHSHYRLVLTPSFLPVTQ